MNSNQEWVGEALEKVREKMQWVSEKNRDKIPYTTGADGSYDNHSDESRSWGMDDGLNWWTNGFWGGIMWLLYQDTGEERYQEIAGISERKLEKCFDQYYGLHHDVGFMYLPTAVADYRLTGNEEGRRIGMHAANLLAGRFNPVGKFIRKYSIDELPQFFNVLRGDMSLVGTRPPTVDEFEQYEAKHKCRLSMTPGLTGMWQISGRSDIKDFDEVVKLDMQYIDNWTILKDIEILIMTVFVVFAGKGSR